MAMFTYDDRVRVSDDAEHHLRPGSQAWVIGVFLDRPAGRFFENFPDRVIYTIEYEDGQAADVHESKLVPL